MWEAVVIVVAKVKDMKFAKYVILVLFILVSFNEVLASNKKIALLIGNYDYPEQPLKNPLNDVNDLSEALEKLGYNVTSHFNLDKGEFERVVNQFYLNQNYSVSLFYYAGHAVQLEDVNYLIPVSNKEVSTLDSLVASSVSLNVVMRNLKMNSDKANLLILDSCRTDPFAENVVSKVVKSTRSFQRAIKKSKTNKGLAPVKGPKGTLIAYSTAPNSVAYDGDGRNGLYTKYLLEYMFNDGVTIEQVFKQIRNSVINESKGTQIPWEHSSLTSEIYFQNHFEYLISQARDAMKRNNLGVAYGLLEQAESLAGSNEEYVLAQSLKQNIESRLGVR